MMTAVVAVRRFFGKFKRMETELLEIQPQELKFTFELKKQCSCSVHLVNKTNKYVVFKVKTTSPKRYCVRPITGVILPMSTCDFTVTMQAQETAPPNMKLKDKFLIQSTIVPYGSGKDVIIPGLFSKGNGRYIEEHKMRVVLVSPPHSPVLQPINGALNHDPINEAPVVKETPISKDHVQLIEVENLPLSHANKTIETRREEESFAIQERDELQQLFNYLAFMQLASVSHR